MKDTTKLIASSIIGAAVIAAIGYPLGLSVEAILFGCWINAIANGYYIINGGWV